MATEVEMRAEQARQVLANPVFKQAFYPLQVAVIDEIKATDVTDGQRRDYLGLKLQAIDEFERSLMQAIEDAQLDATPFQEPHIVR